MRVNIQSEGMTSREKGRGPMQHSRLSRFLRNERALRVALLGFLVLAIFAAFTRRLWHFQFVQGQAYQQEAEEQSTGLVTTSASRGIVYDRVGEQLVRNVPSFYVSVVPDYLPDDTQAAEDVLIRLAVLLDMPYVPQEAEGEGLREVVLDQLAAWLADFSYEEDPAQALHRGLNGIRNVAPYRPIVIERNVEREKALLVAQETSSLPGVSVEVESVRDYPYGPLLSQILGYLLPIPEEREQTYRDQGYDPATDRVGGAGVEATYEEALKGTKGQQVVEEDVLGRVLRVVEERAAPVPGDNVYLTIDLDLQRATEEALRRGLGESLSPRGVAIAMNPQTGEILAMVSLPTYDNNIFAEGVSQSDWERWQDPHRPLINHAVSDAVPPGSVFKIVVASAALQEGVLTPRTQFHCPGRIVVPNKYYPNDPGQAQPFYCWNEAGHGALDVVGGLAQSCDVFFYKTGGGFEETDFVGLGVGRIAEYARLFGLGEPTGVRLPAESGGLVPTSDWKRLTIGESWSTGDTYNLSIGQGYLEVTPLQMLNAVNVVANGGTLYRPQIVHHTSEADGETTEAFEPDIVHTVPVSREHLSLVQEGMEGAVSYGTAARRGQIEGLRIAGKTGTAQFCDDIMCGVGFEQPEHAWFAAYAPIEEPEISVIVYLYNGGEGSTMAVPVAQDILAYYFGVDEEGEPSS
ncbi:MAG: penicillin-binding protein 2 [Anaerolineae bacterium]|nr:penicillin-binding protein 2 [Anaerolineae bacterium]